MLFPCATESYITYNLFLNTVKYEHTSNCGTDLLAFYCATALYEEFGLAQRSLRKFSDVLVNHSIVEMNKFTNSQQHLGNVFFRIPQDTLNL